MAVLTYFDPAPDPSELPALVPNPFDPGTPHALAQRAAHELHARLCDGIDGVNMTTLERSGGGKMFGVLVVSNSAGRVGFLCGFSGMVGGRWNVEGFVPPLFDPIARDAFWPAEEHLLGQYTAR